MCKRQYLLASGILLLAVLGRRIFVNSVELSFELPDNARECFYEEIKKNQTATLEFQVSCTAKTEDILFTNGTKGGGANVKKQRITCHHVVFVYALHHNTAFGGFLQNGCNCCKNTRIIKYLSFVGHHRWSI